MPLFESPYSDQPTFKIAIYRRRMEDRRRWEFLETLSEPFTDQWLYIPKSYRDLKEMKKDDLEHCRPNQYTMDTWGGGHYQFRFFWLGDTGRRGNPVRTIDLCIAGLPRPKW